jgi:hypothetical protein
VKERIGFWSNERVSYGYNGFIGGKEVKPTPRRTLEVIVRRERELEEVINGWTIRICVAIDRVLKEKIE